MPRLPEQNRAIKDKRRQKLMECALKTFIHVGYDNATVDHITKSAKCSHGLFYHYFQKMEDILNAVYQEIMLPSPIAALTTVYDGLHGAQGLRLLAANVEKAQSLSGKDLTTLMGVIRILESKTADKAGTGIRERFDIHPVLSRLIKEGQEEGKVIEGDPDEIEYAFFTLTRGCLIRKRTNAKDSRTISGAILLRTLLRVPDSQI